MSEVIPLKRNVVSISVDAIRESEFPLRTFYDEESLAELAQSLTSVGMLAPLLVTDIGDGLYEIHVGSRRWRAARLKGYTEVPAVIVELDGPLEALTLALAENLQREDLDPFEEARAFLRLMREYGMKLRDIANRVDKTEQYVRRRLELLSLPEAVQENVAKGRLGLQHVPTITGLPTGEEQVEYADKAIRHQLSQPELRALILRDRDEESRPIVRGLTFEKVVARAEIFKRWVRRFPSRLYLNRMNAEEKSQLTKALQDLETVIRTTRVLISSTPQDQGLGASIADDSTIPDNHGQEWPAGHVSRITASDRPPDEVLARELGRTVSAVKQMRGRMSG